MYKLQFEKKHKRGKKTLLYIILRKGWWLILIGIGFIYLSWQLGYGNLSVTVQTMLESRPDWYVTTPMFAEWLLLLGISLLLIAYLEANVYYRYYKIMLDEYAVHLYRGIFFTRVTTIPYEQISNVHFERPYYYRLMGLTELDIVTAADRDVSQAERRSGKFLIPVIDMSMAKKLSRQILECASLSRRGIHVYTNMDELEEEESNEEEDDEFDEEESVENEDTSGEHNDIENKEKVYKVYETSQKHHR